LAAIASAIGLKGLEFENVNIALDTAKKNANPNDLIIVIGSIFLVAEVTRN
jgi:folylpolyglutamate synthase/dihydropteroate synthase